MIERLGPDPGRVLDLGCGTGELMVKIDATKTCGFDISQEMLSQAATKSGLGGRLVVADGHHLPVSDESFDAVTCLISFHYYLEPLEALSEMRRVLRPGGRLLLAALTSLFFESETLDSAFKAGTRELFRVYAPSELQELMLKAGFATVEHKMIRPFTRIYTAIV